MPAKKKTKSKSKKSNVGAKVSTENIKSFMKMNKEMETAVFGFAGELKSNQGKEITPTQLLTQSLKYLKTYAVGNGLDLVSLADRVSPVEGKDYSITSAEEIKRMNEIIKQHKKLNAEVNKEMGKHKRKRSAVRKNAMKKVAKKKKLEKKNEKSGDKK